MMVNEMKKSKGYLAGTRRLLKKHPRERGRPRISKLLYEYPSGSHVVIKSDPSMQKGRPHRRYYGKVGTVVERRGRAYVVSVSQGDAIKEVIVRPEHLEPYNG
jgi:large subunit ribosomal protein L21e